MKENYSMNKYLSEYRAFSRLEQKITEHMVRAREMSNLLAITKDSTQQAYYKELIFGELDRVQNLYSDLGEELRKIVHLY